MIIIGVDSGITGAIAFLSHNTLPDVVDLPTVPIEGGSVTRRVHGPALRSLIRQHCPAGEPVMVVIEQLAGGGRNKDGSSRGNAMSVTSQIDSHVTVRTVCELLGLKPSVVHPRAWKKVYGLDADKKKALALARQLFPACAELLKRQSDHNRADALLIARWAQLERA